MIYIYNLLALPSHYLYLPCFLLPSPLLLIYKQDFHFFSFLYYFLLQSLLLLDPFTLLRDPLLSLDLFILPTASILF